MAKPKPQALNYSLKMIELEKLNILKRTDERIASLQKQAKKSDFSITMAICVVALLLYTFFTLSNKCSCICNL
jgi:hypothetical protein